MVVSPWTYGEDEASHRFIYETYICRGYIYIYIYIRRDKERDRDDDDDDVHRETMKLGMTTISSDRSRYAVKNC